MKSVTEELLGIVSDWTGSFDGAYNIREDCKSAARKSTKNIQLSDKVGGPGLEIHVAPFTQGEKVYIPACVTADGIDDLVYNDFFIGEGADVTVVAGCGVHNEHGEPARHNGIHRFFIGKNARVLYLEKHIGTGGENAVRDINPVTDANLEEGAVLEMDTSQLGGVTHTTRKTSAVLGKNAKLIIRERLLTDGDETAKTDFHVVLGGEDSGVDLVSRSVARGNSMQEYASTIEGNTRCTGHSECDAILADNGHVNAAPCLIANSNDAALIHEAAIGKIAGEQILKLRTLGLTEEEAEKTIINGFLK